MPRTGLSPEEIRSRAIEISFDRMRRAGADKLRLSDVATELDISHAALYAHFSNKAELFDAVVGSWLEGTEIALTRIAQGSGPATGRILSWFGTLYRMKQSRVREDPELYAAFNTAVTRSTPAALGHVGRLTRQLEDLVRESTRPEEAREIAALLFEATMSFHHPSLITADLETDRSDRLDRLLRALMTGLGLAPD